jgi:hypothetical protein
MDLEGDEKGRLRGTRGRGLAAPSYNRDVLSMI